MNNFQNSKSKASDKNESQLVATHIEDIAREFVDIGTNPKEGSFIGIDVSVEKALRHLFTAMFPYHYGNARLRFVEGERRTWELMEAYDSLVQCMLHVFNSEERASAKAIELIDSLPSILEILKTDIRAGYEGDPAAKSTDEIILTYPAFKAITIHRVAHRLYEMEIPLIPRIMSEYAHKITGIDIHPGAKIGKYFFIDHGTGVVVGETTTIGEHVKLYQNVTIGAKSFEANPDGSLVKGIKRHPDIGNHVVIYSGATILGGDTRIGDNCVIGGNVWLTHSVEDGKWLTQYNE